MTPDRPPNLQYRYMASPLAIAETLVLFGPEHIEALSASGMDHLTELSDANRAAGLAPALEACGHEMAGRIRLRQRVLPD